MDHDLVQAPDVGLGFHPASDRWHKGQGQRPAGAVDVHGELQVVFIAAVALAFYRQLDGLLDSRMFGAQQRGTGVEGLQLSSRLTEFA